MGLENKKLLFRSAVAVAVFSLTYAAFKTNAIQLPIDSIKQQKENAASDNNKSKESTATTSKQASKNDRVKISVFYESKCPDSARFVVDQLKPTYQALGGDNNLDVELIHFGKASIKGDTMTCQHGQRECHGNRVFSCIQSRASSMNHTLNAISCIFDNEKEDSECVSDIKLNWDEIEKCASGQESLDTMRTLEKRSGKLSYVPKIEVDGKYDSNIQRQAEYSLKKYVCSVHPNRDSIEACQGSL